MPTLPNLKRERFAQHLASGESATQAHIEAGYKGNRSNASHLAKDKKVRVRVSELLAERETIHAQATAKAIEATALSKAWIIECLRENVQRAMQHLPVKDNSGAAIGEFKYDGAVANRALELLGKELGMFVTQVEVAATIRDVSGEPLSEEAWENRYATEH